mmetsp:Transcript_109237/g.233436  ORF Transcript_109237/g.233436 Transcript_109237/m.233436 type:complete len:324 (+) Transcript_109237:1319-2290(+)
MKFIEADTLPVKHLEERLGLGQCLRGTAKQALDMVTQVNVALGAVGRVSLQLPVLSGSLLCRHGLTGPSEEALLATGLALREMTPLCNIGVPDVRGGKYFHHLRLATGLGLFPSLVDFFLPLVVPDLVAALGIGEFVEIHPVGLREKHLEGYQDDIGLHKVLHLERFHSLVVRYRHHLDAYVGPHKLRELTIPLIEEVGRGDHEGGVGHDPASAHLGLFGQELLVDAVTQRLRHERDEAGGLPISHGVPANAASDIPVGALQAQLNADLGIGHPPLEGLGRDEGRCTIAGAAFPLHHPTQGVQLLRLQVQSQRRRLCGLSRVQ